MIFDPRVKHSLKTHSLLKIVNNSLIDLPSPSNISTLWNFGSLVGICLILQIVRGLFLAIHYSCDFRIAFNRIRHISRDVNFGWALRIFHANGASFFFICLYIHIRRGIYYGPHNFDLVWIVGVTILLLVTATAFLGYVLPWGQISFWGATVITNLFSAIPYLGTETVYWLWGGFAGGNATLTRFFALHFLLPFIILGLSIIHLLFLHTTRTRNPLGLNRNIDKSPFHPHFSYKELLGIRIFLFIGFYICFHIPLKFDLWYNFLIIHKKWIFLLYIGLQLLFFPPKKLTALPILGITKVELKNSLNEEVNRYWEIGEIQSLVNSISWTILYEHEAPICVRIGAATIMSHQRIKYLFKSNESFSLIRSLSKKLLTRASTSEETQWANRYLSIREFTFWRKRWEHTLY